MLVTNADIHWSARVNMYFLGVVRGCGAGRNTDEFRAICRPGAHPKSGGRLNIRIYIDLNARPPSAGRSVTTNPNISNPESRPQKNRGPEGPRRPRRSDPTVQHPVAAIHVTGAPFSPSPRTGYASAPDPPSAGSGASSLHRRHGGPRLPPCRRTSRIAARVLAPGSFHANACGEAMGLAMRKKNGPPKRAVIVARRTRRR